MRGQRSISLRVLAGLLGYSLPESVRQGVLELSEHGLITPVSFGERCRRYVGAPALRAFQTRRVKLRAR